MQHAHLEDRITHKSRKMRWSLMAWGMALVMGGVTAACDGERGDEPATGAVAASEPALPPGPSTEPEPIAAVEASTLHGPPTDLIPPEPGDERLVGTVVEHLPTGGYHYMRIAPEQGDSRWVVTMGGEYREGARVEVSSFGARQHFYSRRLDRHFAELVFGMVDVVS